MAGNVYRSDPPVRLAPFGVAALLATAPAFVPPAAVAKAAYIRPADATLREQPRKPWFALFAPADPVYRYQGVQLQRVSAYARPSEYARGEWLPLVPHITQGAIPSGIAPCVMCGTSGNNSPR